MTAVAASLTALAAVGVLALLYRGDTEDVRTPATEVPTVAPSTSMEAAPVPPTEAPSQPALSGVDGEFIAVLRGYGVPVSDEDPMWTIDLAHAVCGVAHDAPQRYPPGTATLVVLAGGVLKNNPDWTRQQATRFVTNAVDYYCPDIRGPSQREIDSMPPDARYVALLQDRVGITPLDDSLKRLAYQVCDWKTQGWINDRIADAIDSRSTPEDEQVIVETAIEVYCPQYGG